MRLLTWPPVVAMLLIGLLAGCSSAAIDEAEPLGPPLPTLPEVWRLVDADLWAASRQGRSEAERYAQAALDERMERVRQRTEEVYIPWYTSFGTQQ